MYCLWAASASAAPMLAMVVVLIAFTLMDRKKTDGP